MNTARKETRRTPSDRPGQRQALSEDARGGQIRSDEARRWQNRITLAALAVLGLTPWVQAAIQPLPHLPAYCPPLSAFAGPTLFDVFFGTSPIRFPYG